MAVEPDLFLMLWVALVGAVVGSFLNVVIYRLPYRRSLVHPGSACPACGHPVRWYDNVPVLSWVLLRGRCRDCRAAISVRYPVVELLGAAAAVLAAWRYGFTVPALEAALFAWISIALALIDLEHQILPDVITYPSIILGLAFSFAGGLAAPLDAVIGAAVGAALPTAVILLYRAWRGVEGMGWGDVKYLAAIGAVAGLAGCLWVLVVGALLGALVGIGLILAGRGDAQTALPFGTFLAAAFVVWLYVPDWLRSLSLLQAY